MPSLWKEAADRKMIDLLYAQRSALAITVGSRMKYLQWLENVSPAWATSVFTFNGSIKPFESMLIEAAKSGLDLVKIIGTKVMRNIHRDFCSAVEQLGEFQLWAYIPDDDAYNTRFVLRGIDRDKIKRSLVHAAEETGVILYDGIALEDNESIEFIRENNPQHNIPDHWSRIA